MNNDQRYTSLVQFVNINVQQGTSADADFRLRINGSDTPTFGDSGVITAISSTVSGTEISHTWTPPPFILAGAGENSSILMQMLNVDADVFSMDCFVFLFDVRARELTPMGPLLWARGST